MTKLTREQVEQIVREARKIGIPPDFFGADLSGVDLSRADLSGADLRNADLSNANLTSADLSRAFLQGANFNGAETKGASFFRAIMTTKPRKSKRQKKREKVGKKIEAKIEELKSNNEESRKSHNTEKPLVAATRIKKPTEKQEIFLEK